MKQKKTWFDYFNVFFMICLCISMIYPFIYMAAISLSADVFVLQGKVHLWPKGFTTKTYEQVFADERILRSYWNTIVYVVIGTTISLITTSMGAYALSRKNMIWKKQLSFFIVFTMLFNGGMIPTYLVVKGLGLLDTMWAMILPYAISAYNFFVMRTFFNNIPDELEDAGKIDGLNDWGVFWRIAMPLSKPVLATIGLFYAVYIWNNFMGALLYLRDSDLWPLQMILRNIVFQNGFEQDNVTGADTVALAESIKYATILVSTIPILCVYPFIQKYFVKGAMLGSVKG